MNMLKHTEKATEKDSENIKENTIKKNGVVFTIGVEKIEIENIAEV